MKKILIYLLSCVALVSCYDDYIEDFDYDAIYFPYQIDVRTFVVGEGMKIEVGTALGGTRENMKDRVVNFQLDNSLITPAILASMQSASGPLYISSATKGLTSLLPIPSNYVQLSDASQMIIKSGQHMGSIVIKADSSAFLADPATIKAAYVLPFAITSADADSVLKLKRYAVIGLKYENMLFGNYWHHGATIVKRPGLTDTTYVYPKDVKTPESKIWQLTTVAPNALTVNGYGRETTTKAEMKLTLNGSELAISTVNGATYPITADGACTFNRAKLLQDRKIFLKYTYTDGTNTYHATDTLTFRNRIRDGINEWQDENPANYSK